MSETQLKKKQEKSEEHIDNIQTGKLPNTTIAQIAQVVESQFSGPIPPPDIIKGYEEVLPGAAERILSMAEKQSAHRQDMERIMVKSESRDSLLGVIFAFLLGFGCIIAAVIIAIMVPNIGGAIAASIFGVSGVGAIVGTFLRATRLNQSGNNQNNKE